MQKNLKNQKGSIALFVLLSALFFLVVVTSVSINVKNKESKVDEEYAKIKASYEKSEETIYEDAIKKTVTFDANGGTVNIASKVVKLGEKYGGFPRPTRDGYTFTGWITENLFDTQEFYENGKDYNVSMEGDNIILKTYPYQENVTKMPVNCKEKTQYTLSYDWEITNVTSGTQIKTGLGIVFDDGTRLGTANGTTNIITGSSGDKGNVTIVSDSSKTVKYIASAGWSYGGEVKLSNIRLVEGTTEYVTSDSTVTQNNDHTLTAIWKPKEYTVAFNANLFDAPATVENANGLQIVYDKNGSILTFNGKSTKTDTETKIYLSNNYNFNENETYKTTLQHISGTRSGNSTLALIADVRNELGTDITERNYNSTIIPNALGTETETLLNINSSAATEGKAIEYWLSFENGKNNLTFAYYNIKVNFTKVENKKVTYNETYGEMPTPTKNGYEFDGWYTAEQGLGTKIESTSPVKILKDTTLYAKFVPTS